MRKRMERIDDRYMDEKLLKYQNQFYKIMVEYLGEEIFVADGTGKILFVNPTSVGYIGLPVDKIIGRNAADLQREGYFSVSSTMEVLKQKKQVNILQKLKDGRTVLATGVPIFDDNQDEIVMVISTCKDIEELNNLLNKIEHQEREISIKNAEIERLRDDMFIEQGMIFGDESMKAIRDAVMRIAPLEVTVLLEGETGTGKEVVVRTLHRFSKRKNNSFVKINCGIIPENLIEAELFGYEAGSFTGAHKEGKRGQVELADGGTLFLDEIGEMPLHMQVKLLDFLQDGTFTRVGGTEKRKVDARIIAATNRDLKEMSEKGYFRQDLYYRLNVIPIKIPPLRERVGDIEILTKYFISNYN
ncbi:MAG TPA: sigma 54-interacting transcriptional regulator, partial [Anaerovoracaceae bacterium]|nr:sigma 54-interacting transcriptional regulator [Anaerovoracaceae bacterium]